MRRFTETYLGTAANERKQRVQQSGSERAWDLANHCENRGTAQIRITLGARGLQRFDLEIGSFLLQIGIT